MFKLYPKQFTTLSFRDYGEIMRAVGGAKSALEFGPGYTTLALIEAGVERILSLESDPEWLEKKREGLKEHPQVEIRQYWDEYPVRTEEPLVECFDVAMVDAPTGISPKLAQALKRKPRIVHPLFPDCSRMNTCLFALERSPIVLLHDAFRPLERGTLGRLHAMGHSFEFLPGGRIARITRNGQNKNRPYTPGSEELGRPTAGPEPGH